MSPWESGKGQRECPFLQVKQTVTQWIIPDSLEIEALSPELRQWKCLGHRFQDKDSLAGLYVPNQSVRANYDEVYCHFIGMALQNEAIYFFLNTAYNSDIRLPVERQWLNNGFMD